MTEEQCREQTNEDNRWLYDIFQVCPVENIVTNDHVQKMADWLGPKIVDRIGKMERALRDIVLVSGEAGLSSDRRALIAREGLR